MSTLSTTSDAAIVGKIDLIQCPLTKVGGGGILDIIMMFVCAGFNVETVEYKNINFTMWDVGGRDKMVSI